MTFEMMTSKDKIEFIEKIVRDFENAYYTQLNSLPKSPSPAAFLWVGLFGSSKLEVAFRRHLRAKKPMGRPLMDNYRATRHAWYFGSQQDHRYFHALEYAVANVLVPHGINSYVGDEFD